MKKIIYSFLIFFFFACSAYAIIEPSNDSAIPENSQAQEIQQQKEEISEEPIELNDENTENELDDKYTTLKSKSKTFLQGIVEQEYPIDATSGFLKKYLTQHFEHGPISENTFQVSHLFNWSETFNEDDDVLSKFDYNTINIGIKGKFRGGKESYNILLNATPNIHQNFFHRFVLDAWVQTKRIPHHTITFGTFRPTIGYEGAQSAFTVPFIARSQTARNFGNIRKTGIKINGSYKYLDYYLEGYQSDTWYSEFFPGVEGIVWADLKPLANTDGKYGKLKMGGGIEAGRRNGVGYTVSMASLKYDYKKFGLLSEFAWADGSNGGSGLTSKKRWGYNVMLTYMLTKKLQLLARFDDFDNDKNISHNNSREYSAGINYFILGQALRLTLNYVFCQNQAKKDSHKIIFGAQILL